MMYFIEKMSTFDVQFLTESYEFAGPLLKMSGIRNSCQNQSHLPLLDCCGRNLEDLHWLGQQSLKEKSVEDKHLVGKGSIFNFQVGVNVPGNEKYHTPSSAS